MEAQYLATIARSTSVCCGGLKTNTCFRNHTFWKTPVSENARFGKRTFWETPIWENKRFEKYTLGETHVSETTRFGKPPFWKTPVSENERFGKHPFGKRNVSENTRLGKHVDQTNWKKRTSGRLVDELLKQLNMHNNIILPLLFTPLDVEYGSML